MKSLRVLLDWKCNLKCSYCCNEQERFRSQFKEVKLEEIDFSLYGNVCISGGEPLMFIDRIGQVASRAKGYIILYSNGILMTEEKAKRIEGFGVNAINVGLHYPNSFKKIISNVLKCTAGTNLVVRFHVWDKYRSMNLETEFPTAKFKYWSMNDCDRENEERVILA